MTTYVSSKTGSKVFFLTSVRLRPLRDLSGSRYARTYGSERPSESHASKFLFDSNVEEKVRFHYHWYIVVIIIWHSYQRSKYKYQYHWQIILKTTLDNSREVKNICCYIFLLNENPEKKIYLAWWTMTSSLLPCLLYRVVRRTSPETVLIIMIIIIIE